VKRDLSGAFVRSARVIAHGADQRAFRGDPPRSYWAAGSSRRRYLAVAGQEMPGRTVLCQTSR
jgi:hypothetical protein